MSYGNFQPSTAPTPLQDSQGKAFFRALGVVKDWLVRLTKLSVTARFPQQASSDGLGAIGSERQISRGNDPQLSPPETDAAYASRVRDAWNAWQLGGTAWGLLNALAAQGFTTARILQQNGLEFSLSGGNLVMTTRPVFRAGDLWNEFVVYFPSPPSSWTNIVNPPTTSTVPSIDELRKLRKIIKLWQPAVARCIGIGVVTSGSPAFWGQTGAQWGTGHWGGTIVWFSADDFATWKWPLGLNQAWGAGNIPGTWNSQV